MGESKLQKDCCKVARKRRILVRKVHAEGRRGWPDLLLIFPGTGEVVFVEMKHPNGNGVLAELQKSERNKIRAQGASCYICDSLNDFIVIIESHLLN